MVFVVILSSLVCGCGGGVDGNAGVGDGGGVVGVRAGH